MIERRTTGRRGKRPIVTAPKSRAIVYSHTFSALPERERDVLLREHDALIEKISSIPHDSAEAQELRKTFVRLHEKIFGQTLNLEERLPEKERRITKKGEFTEDFQGLSPNKRTDVWNRQTELFKKMQAKTDVPIEREEHDALFLFINGDVFGSTHKIRQFLDAKGLSELTKQAALKDLMDLGFKIFFEVGYGKPELDEYKRLHELVYGKKSILL